LLGVIFILNLLRVWLMLLMCCSCIVFIVVVVVVLVRLYFLSMVMLMLWKKCVSCLLSGVLLEMVRLVWLLKVVCSLEYMRWLNIVCCL